MTEGTADRLLGLKPFLEAHHCGTDVIDEAAAEIKALRERLAQGSAALPSEAIETALSQIDEAERAMIEERKTQYGSAFKNEQLSAIQHLHRQQRAGVKAVERAIRAATPTAPVQDDDASITLDNASVQRLLDYGLLHRGDSGWFVSKYAPPCSTCGATDPNASEFCSNGFHAKGETYWPLSPTPDTGLIEALKAVRPFLAGLTKQGEDNIWRPAERHLAAIDTALANAAPAQVESGK